MDLLAASPLLAIFLVVALGSLLGQIPLGPLKLGAAGALFVGLAIGAAAPEIGTELALVQSLGLALFVYLVGLAAGQPFFADLKRTAPLIGVAALILALAAAGALAAAKLLGVSTPIGAGVYAGALTTTPALAAANTAAGSNEPSVGYAIGYPVGVIVAMIVVAAVVTRSWPGKRDSAPLASGDIEAVSVRVDRPMAVRRVPGYAEQHLRMSYLRREGHTRVVTPGEELRTGDEVLFVGPRDIVEKAIAAVGSRLPEHLTHDRGQVDFKHFVLSNSTLAGKTVAELNLPGRFGGVMTRVKRGDQEMLAADDLVLELSDRVLVVVPRESFDDVAQFFGDSERSISSFSALSVGVGMALGLVLGLVTVSLGSTTFSLGTAAGPLVVGMLLGYIGRTGPIVWQLPLASNLTLRQLGLLIFLAAVGLSAGPNFASFAFTAQGAAAGAVAIVVVTITTLATVAAGRLLGLSAARTAGAVAGIVGQPAIYAYAASRRDDDRIEAGYAALFAVGILVKIVLVTVIVAN